MSHVCWLVVEGFGCLGAFLFGKDTRATDVFYALGNAGVK
jgi:hypothetical protein